ncbi:hypothetical protein [Brazilian marseillevirus]|uniref:hypothetical protein n=1 Tax=Brazilian marseillevirus TaxID=1813599 RepID=UPI000785056F|nr:hypothetical protein A3303_gp183 [Brazilian marseillevirus]AMQ10691.1 hypothetical protein [Brazilian marseillevirus]
MSFDIPSSTELQYLHVCNILSQRAWHDDLKFLTEHWRNDPEERLAIVLPEVFQIKKSGGELRKRCESSETRRLYHIVSEALDLYHASSTDWSRVDTREYTPRCKYCSIRRSARENETSGIIVSSEMVELRNRDIKHRNKAFQRNFEAARLLGIRHVTKLRKYV